MDCMVGIPSRSIYGWSLNSMIKLKSVIILLHESWFIYIYIWIYICIFICIYRPHGHFLYAIISDPSWLVGPVLRALLPDVITACTMLAACRSAPNWSQAFDVFTRCPRRRPWGPPRNGSLCLVAIWPNCYLGGRILHARKRQKPVRTPPPLDDWEV